MSSTRAWAPALGLVIVGWAAAAGAVCWAVLTTDPMDRLVAVVAAVVLVGLSGHATVVRPRLAADHDGITLRTLGGTRHLRWDQFRHRVIRTRRLGVSVSNLEFDAFEPVEDLVVLTRLDLDADPEDVDAELSTLRQSGDR